MKHLVLATALFALAACSHAERRAPSSSQTDVEMDFTFETIAASPDPRATARDFVGDLLTLEVRAAGWVSEVDEIFAHANGSVDLFELPHYRRLLVARPLLERLKDKIVDFYGAAVAAEKQASDADLQSHAKLVVAGVHDALRHANRVPAERVLLNDLMDALRDARKKVSGATGAAEIAPLSPSALASLAQAAAGGIRQMVRELPESDKYKAAVDSLEAEFADQLKATGGGRDPQALNVFPSIGPNGNIDGFTFPRGTWAVTFDDGPHATYTMQHLANLRAAGRRATFFWLAKNVIVYPQIVKNVMAAGMPVENHSWNHPQLDKPSDLARLHTNLDIEINQSTDADAKAYGAKPRFFRCPYGAGFKDPTIRGMIAKLGMIHVRWNVDSLDWQDNNPVTVHARVVQQMRANGRGIILFHDIHTAALTVVPQLFREGLASRWVTIPDIVDELNGASTPAPQPAPVPPPAPQNP
jgi:peptidoglycan/xylan/chitin deacetylase (PgdA/CDA1 family)